jgi:PD-(D/E)XK nuclease superfamily protein
VSTRTKGNSAEANVLRALLDRGFHVLLPFGDGHPYDLVVHVPRAEIFLRVQCKCARPTTDGCLLFNCRTTDHGRGRLRYLGLADLFGVYSPLTDTVYLVPVDELATFEGRLRLQPTRNNQRCGVRMAADYEIDRWTDEALCALAPA